MKDEDREKTRQLFADACMFISSKNDKRKKPAHLFYTHFLLALKYVETEEVGIAAVGFSPDCAAGSLILNPTNAKNMNLVEFSGVVVHEICHLILSHLMVPQLADKRLGKLTNIAMDCEVNQIVMASGYDLPWRVGIVESKPDLAIFPILPETLGEQFKCDPPEINRDWQFYFSWLLDMLDELQKKQEEQEGSAEKAKEMVDQLLDDLYGQTDHEEWGDMSDMSPEERQIMEQRIGQAVEEAAREAGTEGLPGQMRGAIEKLVKRLKPEFSLARYLNEFIARCGEFNPFVRRRMNKHNLLGLLAFRPEKAVGLVLDTSGFFC